MEYPNEVGRRYFRRVVKGTMRQLMHPRRVNFVCEISDDMTNEEKIFYRQGGLWRSWMELGENQHDTFADSLWNEHLCPDLEAVVMRCRVNQATDDEKCALTMQLAYGMMCLTDRLPFGDLLWRFFGAAMFRRANEIYELGYLPDLSTVRYDHPLHLIFTDMHLAPVFNRRN